MANTKIMNMTIIALFAALTAVFSQIMIPLPSMVPINLATLAVFLVAGLFDVKISVTSILIYIALGLIGIPVFAGFKAGFGLLLGPTGGYIIGYAVAALTIGILKLFCKNIKFYHHIIFMIAGLFTCYTLGTFWFMYQQNVGLIAALMTCVVPYLIGDAIKISVATLIVTRLEKMTVFKKYTKVGYSE